ncbi:hypothetical protein [Ascidiaceihabitans sp.]|uniref:hypothetical protein n=1 Tax=Ascidiaceihabitans sp. TaxID=1872644 RepID=UPI00329A1BD1
MSGPFSALPQAWHVAQAGSIPMPKITAFVWGRVTNFAFGGFYPTFTIATGEMLV